MNITIRAMTDADVPAITAMRNLPQVRWGTLATPFESQAFWRKRREAARVGHYSLVACARGHVIGQAVLIRARPARREHAAILGIHVHDDWTKQGVGKKLFAALIDLADNWLGLRRLELGVFADNARAIALYETFGFEVECRERGDAFRDGAFVDSYMMGRLRGHLPPDVSPAPEPPPPAPPGPFMLRAAEPEDLPGLAALMNQTLVRHGTLRTPFCTEEEAHALIEMADPTQKSIVAVAGDVIIGLVAMVRHRNRLAHVAEISLLAVHDAYQGRGVGSALLGALLDVADNWLNVQRLSLDVCADNLRAIALYEKFGFAAEGRKRAHAFRAGGFVDTLALARVL